MTARRIQFDRFDLGMDLRKGASVADANRLRDLKNAYVTNGYAIAKRPGSRFQFYSPTTKGLTAAGGRLIVFHATANAELTTHSQKALLHPNTPGMGLKAVHFAQPFRGYLYVVAEYVNGDVWHHYLDGSAVSAITDPNNPRSKQVTITQERVFAGHKDVVGFCRVANARDWTPAISDSTGPGQLPTGDNRAGNSDCTALGVFQNYLAVFFEDGLQLWVVDPDLTLMALYKNVDSAGTLYPRSVRSTFSDLFYLSVAGFRSVAVQGLQATELENDVGSPIDDLVQPAVAALTSDVVPVAGYFSRAGQYWCATGNTAYVFKFSREAKIRAWSYYTYPFPVDDIVELRGTLYLRAGAYIYQVDGTLYTDNGVTYEVVARLPYLDFKNSGVLKEVQGFDAVVTGTGKVSHLYDPNNESLKTEPIEFFGDTRPLALQPVELSTVSIAPEFINTDDGPFQMDHFAYYYNVGGPV